MGKWTGNGPGWRLGMEDSAGGLDPGTGSTRDPSPLTTGSGRLVTLHGVPDGLHPYAPVPEYEGVDPV